MTVRPELLDQIKRHIALYEQDPEAGHNWVSNTDGNVYPTLVLTMTGRSSGKTLQTPLIYGRDGDNFLIVASLGGAPDHPAWYKNLVAHPDCHIQVKHDHFDVRARTAADDEYDRLWAIVSGVFPIYNDYKARTDRKIPIVVLEPRS